uniref:Uncharacterized protein LOC104232631 n=1 Tax=Nicotiana sylvestris TaxID=4096 RepID=A0A1U7XCK6_NICSY|nr:PREDICTED: uncharacterized protein LOC104232631 [Nicotiana sylvestris]
MEELEDVVFCTDMPKALTHTCLVLLPKVDSPQSFTELRPISLSNFSCKIISKLMNQRLSPLMQKLQIENIVANFFWGKEANRNKRHWIAWNDLCFPVTQGGAGFRSLQDICNVFSAKLWWNFRTQKTMLKDFLEAKYCKMAYPVAKKWSYGQSHTWRRLMDIENVVQPYIFLRLGNGDVSFWCDNWTCLGALATITPLNRASKNTNVKEFMHNGTWRQDKLTGLLPVNVINTIQKMEFDERRKDCPYWLTEGT